MARIYLKRLFSAARRAKPTRRRGAKHATKIASSQKPFYPTPYTNAGAKNSTTTFGASKAPLVIGGGLVYLCATGAGYLWWQAHPSNLPDHCGCESVVTEEERRRAYDDGAKTYDDDVGWHESASFITRRRRQLLAHARGRVLEVAGGTGRNIDLYPPECRVTFTDCSAEMIRVAESKLGQSSPRAGERAVVERVAVMDADRLDFPADSFDTVVDTFGLCSFEHPKRALREMSRVCRPSGRILLLEHGRGRWAWLHRLMHRYSAAHARRWGCWWNRDILALIEAAGLTIVSVDRYHAGTLYVVRCRK
jgi:methyltransferase OMS1